MLFKSGRQMALWHLNLLMWLVFAALFFFRSLLNLPPVQAAGVSIFNLILCLVFSGLLVMIYRKLQSKPGFTVSTAAWIIGLSLAATLIHSLAGHWLLLITGWHNRAWSLLDLWFLRMMFFWLVYMVWSLWYFWLEADRSAQESSEKIFQAQAETERMELQLLRSQLDPHFLFNALNGVAAVVQEESPTAASMVQELADYLRYSLEHRHDSMVRLDREIQAMMGYLRIEQSRFSEELQVEITTDENARNRQVPCFILLPLVENALKHSYQGAEPPWLITIVAEMRGDLLHIAVGNTGKLGSSSDSGVGLDILRRRLALHYPGRHHFALTEEHGRVFATLALEGDPCSA